MSQDSSECWNSYRCWQVCIIVGRVLRMISKGVQIIDFSRKFWECWGVINVLILRNVDILQASWQDKMKFSDSDTHLDRMYFGSAISSSSSCSRCSLFLVGGDPATNSQYLESNLFDVSSHSTVEEVSKKMIKINWGVGIVGHVAQTGVSCNVSDCYQDSR